MKTATKILMLIAVLAFVAAPAAADWREGDEHKMHWPQMPDPNGWDIDMTDYVLADDWECSKSGPVSDIHFWYSVKGDTLANPVQPPHIVSIYVSIHDDWAVDDPGNTYGYSMPKGEPAWSKTFLPAEFVIAGPFDGVQGWDEPVPYNEFECLPNDHDRYWQVNITEIDAPFEQKEGTIYWLDLCIVAENSDHPIGWKTTLNPFNDCAVYSNPGPGAPWLKVARCGGDNETDFAFVITPEPGTMCLLVLGGIGVLLKRKRKS